MFYLILYLSLALILFIYLIAKQVSRKRKKAFHRRTMNFIKFVVVFYCIVSFLTLFIPDAFALCFGAESLNINIETQKFAILRWFSAMSFIALPIAVFYKNRTIRNIAIYFCLAIAITNTIFLPTYLDYATSIIGRGINSIDMIPNSIKEFLLNETFRTALYGALWGMELLVICMLGIEEKHIFNFKSFKEYVNFFFGLIFGLVAVLPIYVPQHLFGLTDIKFEPYSIPHLIWVVAIIIEVIILHFVFRNKSMDTKKALCMFLSLALLMQFNQLFTAISINFKKLPLQLCNIGAYLLPITMMTNSKKLFDFTFLVNVVGVLFALAVPSLDGYGLCYLYNIHFILEHTNLLIVPILCASLGVFPKIDKKSLKNYVLGFLIYFILVMGLGLCFNALALHTGNDFYSANYFFMFDKEEAIELLPQVEKLFDISFTAGNFIFYPVVWVLMYLVFNSVSIILFLICMLVYKMQGSGKKKTYYKK